MAKTLILGNNPEKWWINDLKEASFLSLPDISAISTTSIVRFVIALPKDLDCIVIDVDSLDSDTVELPLNIALYIRLMLQECRKTSLSKIIMVSDLSIEAYMGYGVKSMVLMTDGISLVNSDSVISAVTDSRVLTPADYVDGFLNLIKIEPQEKIEGRHSIANEWGAETLYNVISGEVKSNIIPLRASASLYFKYSSVAALNAEDINLIINGREPKYLTNKITVKNKIRYLLIDDEARKGWDRVLRFILPNAEQEVCSTPVNVYTELPIEVRKRISDGFYDLIFLDLRMVGVSEDSVVKPSDFSGMKILQSIKQINRGIQVIMFTATNKAWNLKALIDAGADGYYMKESPEYHFSLKYSEQNAIALIDTIKECIKNSYLQHIVSKLKCFSFQFENEMTENIENQLSIAFSLILNAKSEPEFAFAYISLEQVFEIASSSLIYQVNNNGFTSFFFTEDTKEKCKLYENGIPKGYLDMSGKNRKIAQWKKVSAIYYQLYNGENKELGNKIKQLIDLRNEYIHPSNGVKPMISRDDFIELFSAIMEFLSVFK